LRGRSEKFLLRNKIRSLSKSPIDIDILLFIMLVVVSTPVFL